MNSPLCGCIYEAKIPGAHVVRLLVLTEDIWNERMSDSVAVPIFEGKGLQQNALRIEVSANMIADCTRTQSIPHKYFGRRVGVCARTPWVQVRIGVRMHIDIDHRIAKTAGRLPETERTAWWPRQHEVFFARRSKLPQDKLYSVISADAWNSRPRTRYCSTVRLTSRTKKMRRRWEVPVAGGWVVSGDIYVTAYDRFDHQPPDPTRYPTALSRNESGEVARRQRATLTLS